MRKMMKSIAAVLAVSAIMAGSAFAADKLKVQNGSSVDVFKVDDTGKITVRNAGNTADAFTADNAGLLSASKLGMGTTTPQAPFHLNLPSAASVLYPVGNKLYNVSSGFAGTTQDNTFQVDLIVADQSSTPVPGYRGALRGVRARGPMDNPTAAADGDNVLSIIGGVYDGGTIRNTADISFIVDGAVASNQTPQRIVFRTRTNGVGSYYERLVVKNDGKIILDPNAMPVYADNTAASSLALGTLYRTPAGALMIRY